MKSHSKVVLISLLTLILALVPLSLAWATENAQVTQGPENSWRFENGQSIATQDDSTLSAQDANTSWNWNASHQMLNGCGTVVPGVQERGIDVSDHLGTIDWAAVASSGDIDFAIIRCGYGDNTNSQDDKQFLKNVQGCQQYGIPFGVYIYSYAYDDNLGTAEEHIAREAAHVLRLMKEANLTPSSLAYPIYIDLEEGKQANLSTERLGAIANTFLTTISNAGYESGVYADMYWWTNYLTSSVFSEDSFATKGWSYWLANWAMDSQGYDLDYTEPTNGGWRDFSSWNMWQCSSTSRVRGISEDVDINLSYDNPSTPKSDLPVSYNVHIQDVGDQATVLGGRRAGTMGQSLRLEAIKANVQSDLDGSIVYRTHVQNVGWQDWIADGALAGTSGRLLRLEAIQIKLTDDLATNYDVYYRVHCQNIGWMGWAKNGESAGTAGLSYRLEAIQIVVLEKGSSAPGSTTNVYRDASGYIPTDTTDGSVSYTTHVQDIGWQNWVDDGDVAGTTGESKRLEGIEIKLDQALNGGVKYKTHVQDIGWQDYADDGLMSGTYGQSLRLEAIQIELTGEAAACYDVYYRVHVQNYGWANWAKNGERSGTAGFSYRLEGIQILLVDKGAAAPANDFGGVTSAVTWSFKDASVVEASSVVGELGISELPQDVTEQPVVVADPEKTMVDDPKVEDDEAAGESSAVAGEGNATTEAASKTL